MIYLATLVTSFLYIDVRAVGKCLRHQSLAESGAASSWHLQHSSTFRSRRALKFVAHPRQRHLSQYAAIVNAPNSSSRPPYATGRRCSRTFGRDDLSPSTVSDVEGYRSQSLVQSPFSQRAPSFALANAIAVRAVECRSKRRCGVVGGKKRMHVAYELGLAS